MKVAIVENEELYARDLEALMQRWRGEHQTALETAVFSGGEELLRSDTESFDLVCMDIQMDGIDGVAAAHQLREQGFVGQLVFVTAYSEYVFEGYGVHALNFLLKPVSYEQIAKCLDFVAKMLNDDHYVFRDGKNIFQIPYAQIICFSSADHDIQIITTEGKYRQKGSLRNVIFRLPDQFHFCHRTAIVNLEHILSLRERELLLSDQTALPVSRTYLKDLRFSLLSYVDRMR